jgi:peptide-methionine (R)-S-oxide reductase
MSDGQDKLNLSDTEWRKRLDPARYEVLRKKGTEMAFSGELNANKENGRYLCAGCGQELFLSESKFESGCGWPSFSEPMGDGIVNEHSDKSHNMVRTEVVCSRCGGHLGHVFPDGPEPTGLRYCVNSASLEFEKSDAGKQ